MSVQNPAHKIKRWSVVGMEGMWTKMFDPPTESPETPDRLVPTNPVPEVMANAGYQSEPKTPHTVELDLMHGLKIPTWDDAKEMMFFLIRAAGNPAAIGTFPGPCVRMPRGSIFHAHTLGHGPPPHTIHWHGIEPTPMNDGVGHCSMEIGDYTYQFQPNFIGTYFYHCHRNTVQHFEFGLYGMLIVDPPDTYFATQKNPEIKIGHCRDGKRRTAANLSEYYEFPGFNNNPLTAADPEGEYQTDPHAMTVTYDVEALWVYDDRDSVWSDLAPDARATYPKYGDIPGVNDNFHGNAGGGVGPDDFFAFNDFNPDYWYVTGVPVPAHKGGIGTIPTGLIIPPELNSGVSGTQVSISAQVGQTILLRCLNGAYSSAETTFPVDVVIIAWDGRALGVPPYGQYNHAYKIPAGTPIRQSVARRCDILIRSNNPIDSSAEVKFINTRGENIEGFEETMVTARIPIKIGGEPIITKYSVAGTITDQSGNPLQGVTLTVDPVSLGGTARRTVLTDDNGTFSIPELLSSMYEITPSLAAATFIPPFLRVAINDTNVTGRNFSMSPVSLTVTPDKGSPQQPGSTVLFTAAAEGGSGAYQYRFRLHNGTDWTTVQDFSATAAWTWNTADAAVGAYMVQVSVRNAGSASVDGDATTTLDYALAFGPSTGVTLTSDAASPQPRGAQVKFTAVGQGGSGSYEYQFILVTGGVPATVRSFSPTATWTWNSGSAVAGTYQVQVLVRNAGSSSANGDANASVSYTLAAAGTVGVSLASDLPSPRNCGEQVVFTANGTGGTGSYEYEFLLYSGGRWKKVQAYSTVKTWTWTTAASAVGTHKVQVNIRTAGSISTKGNAKAVITYKLAYIRSTGVTVDIDKASPQAVGTTVTFTAAGQGGTGFYQYEFWLLKKSGWKKMQSYSATPLWTWDTSNLPVRTYRVQVRVRSLGSKLSYHARNIFDYIITA